MNYLVHIGDIPESTIDYQTIVNAATEYKIYNAFKYTDTDGTYTIQKPIRSTNDGMDDAKLAELINLRQVPQGQFLMKFAAGTDVAFTGTINNSDQEFTYDGNTTIKLLEKAQMEEGPVEIGEIQGTPLPLPLIDIFKKLTSEDASGSGEVTPRQDISGMSDLTPGSSSLDSQASTEQGSRKGSLETTDLTPGPGGGKRKTKSKRSSKKKRNTKKKRKTQNKKKSRKTSKK